eukprot:100568_1
MNVMLQYLAICSLYWSLVCGYIGVNDNTLNGAAAEAYCWSNFNSHLASIHSQSDQDELLAICDTLNSGMYCLIGFNDKETEGTWVWNDASCVTYTNWIGYMYDQYGSLVQSTENQCGYLYRSMHGSSFAGKWFHAKCIGVNANLALQPFICNDAFSGSSACSDSPTQTPSTSPISSCLDYNNETSADGNKEMRQFDDQHITNIDNYFMNGTFVSEFDSSYAHDLIECVGSDCIIHCNQSASCLATQIEINVQNKTTLLLCHDAYSCPDASVKTQSASMANISVVCIGKYSCINMDIHLANISSFNLYCLQHGACWDVNVTIDSNNNDTRHNDGIITCVSLHSCDHLVIATNSNQSQLIMYEHSEDVILNNGA